MRKRVVALVMTIVLVLSMSGAVLANPTNPALPPQRLSIELICPASCTVGETYTCPAYYENLL